MLVTPVVQEDRYLPKAHRLAFLAGQHMLPFVINMDCTRWNDYCDGDREQVSISLHHHPDMINGIKRPEVAQHIGLTDPNQLTVNGGGDFDVGGPWVTMDCLKETRCGCLHRTLVLVVALGLVRIHKTDRVGFDGRVFGSTHSNGIGNEARHPGWHPGDASPTPS